MENKTLTYYKDFEIVIDKVPTELIIIDDDNMVLNNTIPYYLVHIIAPAKRFESTLLTYQYVPDIDEVVLKAEERLKKSIDTFLSDRRETILKRFKKHRESFKTTIHFKNDIVTYIRDNNANKTNRIYLNGFELAHNTCKVLNVDEVVCIALTSRPAPNANRLRYSNRYTNNEIYLYETFELIHASSTIGLSYYGFGTGIVAGFDTYKGLITFLTYKVNNVKQPLKFSVFDYLSLVNDKTRICASVEVVSPQLALKIVNSN